jgi:hypothetical protein
LDAVHRACGLRDDDAVFLISTAGAGNRPEEDFKKWSAEDRALWSRALNRVLGRHDALNVRNQAARQVQLAAAAAETLRSERAARLRALSILLSTLEADVSISPQKRGKRFEEWLGDLFDVYSLEKTLNVINSGEQIDFTFWKGDLFVIGEARWHTLAVDAPQVRDFFEKLRERPSFAVGLLISMSGLTDGALDALRKRSGDRLVLTLDRDGLRDVLQLRPEFTDWLSRALRERLEHPNG